MTGQVFLVDAITTALEDATREEECAAEEDRSALAITRLLQMQHPAPEWSCFEELRYGTGYGAASEQRLDLFALNLWPSKKFRSIAYEVKISRADFMREIRNPAKRAFAEAVAGECYFAVPLGLVRIDEVPEGWGMVERTKGGMRMRKAATQRTIAPWPMRFAAAIARRAADPEPALKKAAWRHCGSELDEATLVRIAEETFNRSIERERRHAQAEAEGEVRKGADYQQLVDLRAAVGRVTGIYMVDAARFTRWAAESKAMQPETRRALQTLYTELKVLLGEEGQQ